jgi:large subunit ribosomal protein L17
MSSHLIRGRQLSRDTEHRKSLRRSLVQSLIEHGKIRTTLPKAKEVRSFAEKIITLARTGTLHSRRRVIAMLNDRRLVDEDQEFTGQTVVQKLFDDVAPKFNGRNGGYTRIIKLSIIASAMVAASASSNSCLRKTSLQRAPPAGPWVCAASAMSAATSSPPSSARKRIKATSPRKAKKPIRARRSPRLVPKNRPSKPNNASFTVSRLSTEPAFFMRRGRRLLRNCRPEGYL